MNLFEVLTGVSRVFKCFWVIYGWVFSDFSTSLQLTGGMPPGSELEVVPGLRTSQGADVMEHSRRRKRLRFSPRICHVC